MWWHEVITPLTSKICPIKSYNEKIHCHLFMRDTYSLFCVFNFEPSHLDRIFNVPLNFMNKNEISSMWSDDLIKITIKKFNFLFLKKSNN